MRTLFHKVFKVKIFPDCSIMVCDSSNKGSYAWKSLYQARHVIELGMVQRVGDGQSIKSRSDKWLPKIPCARIVSPASVFSTTFRVFELIDEESHSWKTELIEQELSPQEASLIIGLPLSSQATPNKQVWLPTPQGNYLNRSAYKLQSGVERSLLPSCSNSEKSHLLWNGIWNLQVPHNVKHMI